jgi:hypothetical protein
VYPFGLRKAKARQVRASRVDSVAEKLWALGDGEQCGGSVPGVVLKVVLDRLETFVHRGAELPDPAILYDGEMV